jgi:hypothetical protein
MAAFYDVMFLRDDVWALLCSDREKQETVAWFTSRKSAVRAMSAAQQLADFLGANPQD